MNTHKLAWAAGFFDGEGNTCYHTQKHKGGRAGFNTQHHFRLQIGQRGKPNLIRFMEATGNKGKLYGPYTANGNSIYHYKAHNFEDIQYIICLIWNWLGPSKRNQYKKELKEYLEKRYGKAA